MTKKLISLTSVFIFLFSPGGFSQDSMAEDPTESRIDKAIAEADRNRELLEIWKEHVKTLTQERDDAYRQIESLKTANSSPVIVGQPARFGEIETQPLSAAMAMPKNAPLQAPAMDNSGLLKDIQGYQESIRALRAQMDEVHSQNQRMQKEITESANDKTLIIKEKEQAVGKIEALSKQIQGLKDENQKLTGLLHSADLRTSAAQPAVEAVSQPKPLPAAPVQNVFEVNYLKSQNNKLKTELEKLRAGMKTEEAIPGIPAAPAVKIKQIESENTSLRQQLSDTQASLEAMKHNFNRLRSENEDVKAEYERLKSDLSTTGPTAGELEAQTAKAASLQQILTSVSAEKSVLKDRSQTLTAQVNSLEKSLKEASSERTRLKQENEALLGQISALKSENGALAATTAGIQDLEGSRNTLKMNLEKNAAEKDELLERNRALMEELNTSKENAKQIAASLSSALADVSASKGSLDALKMNLEKNAAEKDELLNRNRALMQELNESKESIKQMAASSESLMREYNGLKEKLSAAVSSLDEKTRIYEDRQNVLISEKSSLEKQNNLREEEVQKIRSEMEILRRQAEALKADAAKIPQYETEKKYLQNIYAETSYRVKRNQSALDQAIRKLEASKEQNKELAARIQASQSERQALQADSDVLKTKLQALSAERDSMNGQIAQFRGTIGQLQAQARKAKNDLVLSEEKIRAAEAEKAGYSSRIESLRSQITLLEAEKGKINSLQAEKERLIAESDTMKKAMVDLEREAQANEDRVGGLRDRISALEGTNTEQAKTIETLNASLKQSLDDIQNLKNNFQAYLESLVTSFEDRQKKGGSAPTT